MSEQSTPRELTLGVDLGTSAVKAVAMLDGALVGEMAASFATASAAPLQAEQDTSEWLRAATEAMQALTEHLNHVLDRRWQDRVAAIGLTGQLPTLVCLGDNGTALAPAITWKDGRADAWAAGLIDQARRSDMYARTGMPIDGRYLAPMLRYHFADRLGEVRCVLSAKDYLLSELTGLRLTEPSTAAGYGIYDLRQRRFSESLGHFWKLPSSVLPSIRPANSLAGPLNATGAQVLRLPVGIPVSTGAADSVCASFAMAGLDQRVVSISFGTSAVVISASDALELDPRARYLVTPHIADGWYGREMDLLSTGTGYRWLSDLFGWKEGELDAKAAQSPPGAHGLFFPPYLAGGEQGALWNPRLQSAIFGINLRHSSGDMARAFLEGVFFEIRRCIEVLAETTPITSAVISGNIVRCSSSMQMLADVLNRPVCAAPDQSPAAIGAAWLAGGMVRHVVPLRAAAHGSAPRAAALTPSATARDYQALYPRYLERAAQCAP